MHRVRNVQALVVLEEERHFGRAAARLMLTQPALSRRIQSLEADIGMRLVERDTRKVALTPAGARFVLRARDALARLQTAMDDLKAEAAGVKGFLRIGYNRIALHGPLLALVRRYRELYPEVKVELIFLPSREQCTDVAAGTLDAGFIVGSPTTEVEAMVVDDEKLVAALPLGHPLGDGPIPIGQLADQPFVLGDRLIWGTYVPIVHEACRKAGFQPNIVQEAGTSEAVLGLVAAGFGVTLYLRRHGDAPGVIFADLTDCDDTVQTVLVWRPGERSPQLNRFLALTREKVPQSVLRLRVRRNLVPAPVA